MTPYRSKRDSFEPWPDASPLRAKEMEQLRRRAWTEQGVLIVSPAYKNLTSPERTILCQIGERLYGSTTN